ncbi:MAG: hypothetical protein KIY12_03130 [Thermoplasmata archaeon]|uniref:H/ACA RNA-protein complex component Gar1 n=1 Tax=Candidatus Sysuiplasma superficiale TaxID=2823368 RepID=A0A8J7YQ15_9ARCH|nr:hypothetical protein [Candidatus Sysuiplasma superficiale]MBX8643706.1 hypothetical protein [Candidatus Sysuiplasma superficiale]MCL4347013.1 hypothetical protein [Candidatus Thermoplasmatota archaeon]
MRLLGSAKCYSSANRIVVDGVFAPEEKQKVFDRKGREIGTVKDIFGNVERPFISVNTLKNLGRGNLNGLELYVEERETDGKSKGDKRGSRRG